MGLWALGAIAESVSGIGYGGHVRERKDGN